MRRAFDRLKGLADNMFPRLRQHLDGYILRDHIPLNQGTDKIIFRIGCRREADFNFLKANQNQHPKELQLFLKIHRLHQRLVSIAQIDTAPEGCFVHILLFYPVTGHLLRHKIRSSILFPNLFSCHFKNLHLHFSAGIVN